MLLLYTELKLKRCTHFRYLTLKIGLNSLISFISVVLREKDRRYFGIESEIVRVVSLRTMKLFEMT